MNLTKPKLTESARELQDLVRRARGGERQAFDELMTATQGLARKTAFPLLPRHLVDDAVQEAYIVVYQKLHHLRKPEAFQGWLCRIVLNVCHALRKNNPISEEFDEQAAAPDTTKQVDARLALRQALSQLPEDTRNTLILREFLKLDYEEISYALQLPLGTVRSKLHYGRKKLAKLMGD